MGIETATATILVTDVVASTSLRVRLGEEGADALRRELDAALGEVVQAHGGSVVKGLGDGVLAMFPGSAEAVTAGVAIQQTANSLGRRASVDLAVRIGVSAGDVSIEDGDCFGTPVVEASRLCAAAGGGEVVVADVVRVLGRGRGTHEFERRGALELKGLPEAVEAWTVPWEPASTGTGLRQDSPYVGRTRERIMLRELLDVARSGKGGTVLVSGEPGIGKTRLVTEACRDAGGFEVLWGACHDGDVTAAAAFSEAVTTWARATDPERVRAMVDPDGPVLATLAPSLRAVLPGLGDAADIAPDAAAARLQDAVCQWLVRLASSSPVVFVIDDLHWADDATVRLLRAVARQARTLRVLVVGTYRETDLDRSHPLAEALPLLRREVEPAKVALDGLDAGEVEDLLRRMAGHDVPAAFATLLADQCDGNPFFIRETLLHLWEEGRIAQQDGVWVATTAELGIPEGIREVLGRRLARLSPDANKLLGIAALFEIAFPLPVVCDVAHVAEDDALDLIDETLAAQIVRAGSEFDTYEFTHALFRHTLVAEMNPSRQVRTHRALAEAIEKRLRGEPSAADAATLARHFWRSAVLPGAERGVPYAVAAATAAVAGAAFREAYEFFAIARELLEPGDDREVEVQRGLATAAVLAELPVDDLDAEAARLGELIAAVDGDDAAVDELVDLARLAVTA
ncbi:MAG: ATP-binding protein, partial [Actinomycetota bacterium]